MNNEQDTNELAEAMESVFENSVGTPVPDSKGDAAVIWYLKALQRLDKRAADLVVTYDAMRDEITQWLRVQDHAVINQRAWLDKQMLPTVEAVTREKTAHSGKKSFNFCYGVCSFKKQQDQYEWPDGDASITDVELIKWVVKNCPTAITYKPRVQTISKRVIKSYIEQTGDTPPMVKVTPQDDQFYVNPAPLALSGEQPALLGK